MDIESNVSKDNNTQNIKEELHMAVMAKPSKQAFVVSSKDKEKFQNEKMPKSNWEIIRKMATNFDKINLKND